MKKKNRVHFILGGVKSGKSKFAENILKEHKKPIFIATGKCLDSEMENRIKIHQKKRNVQYKLRQSSNCIQYKEGVTRVTPQKQ